MHLDQIPLGSDALSVPINGRTMTLYTYRPEGQINGVLFSCHGVDRNADDYRRRAIPPADRHSLLVIAPEFPYGEEGWFNWEYNRGGLFYNDTWYPEDEWTMRTWEALIAWSKNIMGVPPLVWMFGHSAGAQALSRFAAYSPHTDVQRIIIANPSTYVWPALNWKVPYGFSGFDMMVTKAALLKSYLSAPITIYAGNEDTDTKNMSTGQEAMAQGDNRWERAQNCFAAAEDAARENGFPLNWNFVVAEGVGHSSSGMLKHDKFDDAMKARTPPKAQVDTTNAFAAFDDAVLKLTQAAAKIEEGFSLLGIER